MDLLINNGADVNIQDNKWKCKVGEKLLIIKANEIKQIRKSEYNIFKYIMVS